MLIGILSGCESTDKEEQPDTTDPEEEIALCPNDVYPALLQVWSSAAEEGNFADTPPVCEAPFDIELLEGGGIYSAGDCEFEGGQQTRTLSYEFQGQLEEAGHYVGEVLLTKRNGEQEQASFSGDCTANSSSDPNLQRAWQMFLEIV